MGTRGRRISLGHLANDFCRSCGNECKIVLRLLCTCSALDRRRKRHLLAYYMENLDELSCTDVGSLSRFFGSSE